MIDAFLNCNSFDKVMYGCDNNYIDVTALFLKHYFKNNRVIIPVNNCFNNIFGDPYPNKIKDVILYKNSIPIKTINEYCSLLNMEISS